MSAPAVLPSAHAIVNANAIRIDISLILILDAVGIVLLFHWFIMLFVSILLVNHDIAAGFATAPRLFAQAGSVPRSHWADPRTAPPFTAAAMLYFCCNSQCC
jgi:hypothetical protein